MVQIKNWAEIDEEKLRILFKKRGHGILHDNFLEIVKKVLDGKYPELEVHQCECGDLLYLSHERANELRKKYSDKVLCKRCGGYEEEMLNLELLKRFTEITEFIDNKDVFVTKTEQNMFPEDVKILDKMAKGLFPTSTHAEMLVGYYDFMEVFFAHFPNSKYTPMPEVEELMDKALKTNEAEFERLYSSICDWKKSHQGNMNIYGKEEMLSILASQDSIKTVREGLIQTKKIDTERVKLQLELSTYQDTVEVDMYIDFLLNLMYIIEGEKVIETPFSKARLPTANKGKYRNVISIADKVEYLDSKLPFSLKPMYNTHLRNAVAHNQLEILLEERAIVLTNYSEKISIEHFRKIFSNLKHLHGSISTYLSKYQISKTRPKVSNQGMAAAILGYTDFFEEGGKLHPAPPCDAQLNLYQFWDFVKFEGKRRIFPKFNLKINMSEKSLTIDFGENGGIFLFPNALELTEWLEEIVLTSKIHVVLYTIAPILPVFSQFNIMRCNVGQSMDVYVLAIDEITIDVNNKLLEEISGLILLVT